MCLSQPIPPTMTWCKRYTNNSFRDVDWNAPCDRKSYLQRKSIVLLIVAPHRAILWYHRCDNPYRAILFKERLALPQNGAIPPPLVPSFTQAHLCDTPCNVSRDNCAIPHLKKASMKELAILSLQVSRDMKSIAAGPRKQVNSTWFSKESFFPGDFLGVLPWSLFSSKNYYYDLFRGADLTSSFHNKAPWAGHLRGWRNIASNYDKQFSGNYSRSNWTQEWPEYGWRTYLEDPNLLKLRSLFIFTTRYQYLGTMNSNVPNAMIARLKTAFRISKCCNCWGRNRGKTPNAIIA